MLTTPGGAASIPRRVFKRASGCACRRLGAVALALALETGCASSTPVRPVALPDLRHATVEEVLSAWDRAWSGATLSASGDLSVRDDRNGRTSQLGVRVVVARGGRLYLKGSVAIVTGVEVTSDGQRFWFSLPRKKKIWTGLTGAVPPAEPDAEGEPYYALRPSDITGALLPEPLDPGPDEALILSGDRQSFVVTLGRSSGGRGVAVRRVWLDREALQPQREHRFDEDGDLVTDIVWRDWEQGWPRDVSIVRPMDGYLARFLLHNVRIGVEIPEQAFTGRIPEGYEVVEVES